MKRGSTILAAMLLLAAATPSTAANFGSNATFMGIWSRYVDLDPLDGIRATGTLMSERVEAKTELFSRDGQRVVTDYGSGPPTSFLSSQIRAGTSATSGMSIIFGGIYPFVDGMASSAGSFNAYRSSASYTFSYELAPHTGMLWETSYIINAWAKPNKKATAADQASGSITLLRATNKAGATAYADPKKNEGFAMAGGNFSEMLRNDTNVPLIVSGVFAASAFGGIRAASIAAPIPEPSTYAMMAAGIGVVGFCARRRRRLER